MFYITFVDNNFKVTIQSDEYISKDLAIVNLPKIILNFIKNYNGNINFKKMILNFVH